MIGSAATPPRFRLDQFGHRGRRGVTGDACGGPLTPGRYGDTIRIDEPGRTADPLPESEVQRSRESAYDQ